MAGTDDDNDSFDKKVRDQADERVGMVVGGKYRIVKALGIGGMGAVYEVEHELIGKRMALKCLHPEYARDRDLIERFRREARAATAIGNEHIVDVTDMGDLPDGAPFLVMEMLKGQALADLMDTQGVLPIGRTVGIIRQICFALQAAHEKGIVHRDMKPENVFLQARSDGKDFAKVLDFGISKMHEHGKSDRGLTRTGIAMGTPSYMSPEQAQGAKDVDARTDIWAVGVMMYEMLTLRRPFEADSYPMMLMAIVSRDPESVRTLRADVSEELDQIILRTLIKPVGLRTQSMKQLAEELLPFVDINTAPQIAGQPRGSNSDNPSSPNIVVERDSKAESDSSFAKSGTVAAGGADTGRGAAPATRVGEPLEKPAEPARPSSERKHEPTGELGVVERKGREATSSGTSLPVRGNSTTMIGVAIAAIGLLAVGAWAMSGPGEPPVSDPPTTVGTPDPVGSGTAPPVSVPVAPIPAVVPPVAPAEPAEVMVQITTAPSDARIEINDMEFPNPMSAHRLRSLDPVTIRISAPGYETIERLAIFDHEQSFMFQLSRGRGVRREGTDGRVRESGGGGGASTGGSGASTGGGGSTGGSTEGTGAGSGSGTGFRDDF